MTLNSSPVEQEKRPKISVIMPAFNESQQIYENLIQVCTTLQGHSFEIIVVDDGSQDTTFAESQRVISEGFPVRAIRQDINRGKGKAIFEGFKKATGDLVVFLDSDLEISPENIFRLLDAMRATGAEVAIGSKESTPSTFPITRQILSVIYRQLVKFLFGLTLTDTQTGIKIFRRAVLEQAIPRVTVSRFAFDIELLVAAIRYGYRIVECPVNVAFHRAGYTGRIGYRQMFGMLADTLSIYYRASFWNWLEPGGMTRFWIVMFCAGIFLLGIGLGKLITPLVLRPPIQQIFYIVALQFLPSLMRDWLLVLLGGGLLFMSLIELNKSLLSAFARRDRGGLADIWPTHQKHSPINSENMPNTILK